MSTTVRRLTSEHLTTGVVDAISSLLDQLGNARREMDQARLLEIVDQDQTRIYVAFLDGDVDSDVVGMLTCTLQSLPSRRSMIIEDVVTRADQRRLGIGRALVEAAIACARECDVDTIDLTTNPRREPANRMYGALGFDQLDLNVYRLKLGRNSELPEG